MRRGSWCKLVLSVVSACLVAIASCSGGAGTKVFQAADLWRHAVIIVEVVANAPGDTASEEIPNESITLLNNTEDTVNLAGLTISDEHGDWTIGNSLEGTILQPGERWTVKGSTYNPRRNCYTAICLANKGEQLELSYDGVPIDRIHYPSCGGSANDGKVLVRDAFVILLSPIPKPSPQLGSPSVTLWGAAQEVDGSCYQIKVGETDILVDCGSYMGSSTHKDDVFDFVPSEIDAVIITHAHDDHIGRLHYLFHQGYDGPVYMTMVTADLYLTKLADTIHYWQAPSSQKVEVEKAIRRSIHEVEYRALVEISDHVVATFLNAGHIPGSASISLNIQTEDVGYSILFSGDIGPSHHPFLEPPDYGSLRQDDATVLVIESTYGGTVRGPLDEPYTAFWDELAVAVEETELVVIPTLSLDRTQRVLAAIGEGMEEDRLPSNLTVAVGRKSSCYLTEKYVEFQRSTESGAIDLTRRYELFFSDEFWEESYLWPRFWAYTRGNNCGGWEDYDADFKGKYDIVVTPSGFGNLSLSKRLLERYVGDPEVAFVKVSWAPGHSPMGQFESVYGQAEASITIEGTPYPVAARLVSVSGVFSGHSDQDGLVRYAASLPNLATVVITHGELSVMEELRYRLGIEFDGLSIMIPEYGASILLGDGE
jgi:metallo-beta-lactamase family protein